MAFNINAKGMDYRIDDGKFFTSKGKIPNGCFAQLMTELNGDNSVAAIFINKAQLRGCIRTNEPYPGGTGKISYAINKSLANHEYKLTVCQSVSGSMGGYCDKILVRFVNRKYMLPDRDIKTVLSLEKMGEW